MIDKNIEFNKRAFRATAFAAAFAALIFAGSASASQVVEKAHWSRNVSPGIVFRHYEASVDNKPVHIYVADVDLANPRVKVQPLLAWDHLHRLETVVSMARRHGAAAAINGSYFDRDDPSMPYPIGFLMIGGRVVYYSHAYRSAFGLTRAGIPLFGYPRTRASVYMEGTGQYFYLDGMNRERRSDESIAYTIEYGHNTGTSNADREIVVKGNTVAAIGKGNMAIPTDGFVISLQGQAMSNADIFKLGARVKLYFVIESEWLKVFNAITGGPLLLTGGRLAWDSIRNERFNRTMSQRNPLTAVGSTPDGHLLLFVVDGRQKNFSVGLSYAELAQFMAGQGVVNAIAMDGGGSSTMVINGEVVNHPSDGKSRAVSNSICVFQR